MDSRKGFTLIELLIVVVIIDNVTYTTSVSSLTYQSSAGVTVTLGTANASGWNATAKHNGTSKTCGIFYGTASAPVAGANEGEPKCQ